MSTTAVPGFPNSFQTEYAPIPKAPLAGSLFEEAFLNVDPFSVLLPFVDEVAFSKTLTIGNSTADGDTGISIDGGQIVISPSGNTTTDALALDAAIKAAGFAWTVYIAASTPAAAVVTITGVLGQDPVITAVQDGSTTLVIGVSQAAVLQPAACFGEGVVAYGGDGGLNNDKVRRPSALTDRLVGVISRSTGSIMPAGQLALSNPGLHTHAMVPGQVYTAETRAVGIMVDYVGTAPTTTDGVYHVKTGPNAGQWAASDGGTSETTTLTFVTVAADLVEFTFDGLPALSIASATGTEVTDVADLHAQWLASAAYMGLVGGDTSKVVDNLDGTLTVTFADTTTHIFVDGSGGTSSITEAVDTPAVAVNAVLEPTYSWAQASIIETADEPGRAYLRIP